MFKQAITSVKEVYEANKELASQLYLEKKREYLTKIEHLTFILAILKAASLQNSSVTFFPGDQVYSIVEEASVKLGLHVDKNLCEAQPGTPFHELYYYVVSGWSK